MSTLIVVFHKPDDDQAGELNDKLRQKGALVDSKNRVGLLQFPDGWLIVCYDDTPDDQIKNAISDKINAVQPERKILLIHRTTRERSPGIVRDQVNLASRGNVLEGADCDEYNHIPDDELYKGLIRSLTENKLAIFFSHLEKAHKERTEKKNFSNIKHQLTHLFLPIDLDLQGLIESGNNLNYAGEIVQTHHGKTAAIIEQAKTLVYRDPNRTDVLSLQKLVEETELSSTPEWQSIQALLPCAKHEENLISSEERRLFCDAQEILNALEDEKRLYEILPSLNNGNAFRVWFLEFNAVLNALGMKLAKRLDTSA